MAKTKVQVLNKQEFQNKLKKLVSSVSTKREKQKILTSGAKIARNYAKNVILKKVEAKKVLKYYRNGKVVAAILPGNLKRSLYVFKQKQGDNVEIGPRVLRKISPGTILGSTPKGSSGFYAAMLFGSANEFRTKVTDAAIVRKYGNAIKAMAKTYNKILDKLVKKYGL